MRPSILFQNVFIRKDQQGQEQTMWGLQFLNNKKWTYRNHQQVLASYRYSVYVKLISHNLAKYPEV